MKGSFVYYSDGHHYDGDMGFKSFPGDRDGTEALQFIQRRMENHPEATVKDYVLIRGEKATLEPVEVVTKLRIAD